MFMSCIVVGYWSEKNRQQVEFNGEGLIWTQLCCLCSVFSNVFPVQSLLVSAWSCFLSHTIVWSGTPPFSSPMESHNLFELLSPDVQGWSGSHIHKKDVMKLLWIFFPQLDFLRLLEIGLWHWKKDKQREGREESRRDTAKLSKWKMDIDPGKGTVKFVVLCDFHRELWCDHECCSKFNSSVCHSNYFWLMDSIATNGFLWLTHLWFFWPVYLTNYGCDLILTVKKSRCNYFNLAKVGSLF